MGTLVVVIRIATLHGSNVVLVAENSAEGFRSNQFITENPLARLFKIFDKRIALQVRSLGTGVVDFDPTRIIAILVEPVKIDRGDFRNHERRISFPVGSRILRNRVDNNDVNRIARFRVNRTDTVATHGRTRNVLLIAGIGLSTTAGTSGVLRGDGVVVGPLIGTGIQSKGEHAYKQRIPDVVFKAHMTSLKKLMSCTHLKYPTLNLEENQAKSKYFR